MNDGTADGPDTHCAAMPRTDGSYCQAMTTRTSTTRFGLTHDVVTAVAAKLFPAAPVVKVVPMRGGLEAAVARITLRDEARRERHVVVKRLGTDARHEAARYRMLASSGVTPSFLGTVDHDDSTYLFLERVRPVSSWPWRDSAHTRRVLEQLARVHRFSDESAHVDDWNYEAELLSSAAGTVAFAGACVTSIPELDIRRELRPLRRVAASLGELRRQMNGALGTTLVHGDVHSGNVILRTRGGRPEVLFLDWGRSRIGSPLEDVSSWLLSLRSWEPAAARDHDTLFRAYLAAADRPPTLTPELRDAYWIAAASNVLAGALRYQLVIALASSGKRRATALAQARAALRVIRRADERLPRA
jgi:aminoglycoside phosphotransferase